MVGAQLRFRRARFVATLLAVSIAVASFSLLASAARGSQLRAVGTVQENFRPGYDLLVRPAADPGGNQVSYGTVAATYGGISTEQWHRVLAVPGVSVAAPVAMVGYVMHETAVPVDLSRYVDSKLDRQVLRVRPTWVGDRGRSRVTDGGGYLYVTSDRLTFVPGKLLRPSDTWTGFPRASALYEEQDDGSRTAVCNESEFEGVAPLAADQRRGRACWSSDPASNGNVTRTPQSEVLVPEPMLLAAIDPEQEAKLNGLDAALDSGQYFGTATRRTEVPVLMASRPQLDRRAQVSIDRLSPGSARRAGRGVTFDNLMDGYETERGTSLGTVTISEAQAYQRVLQELRHPRTSDWKVDTSDAPFPYGGARPQNRQQDAGSDQITAFWAVGAPRITTVDGRAAAQPQRYTGVEWGSAFHDAPQLNPLPLELSDTPLRAVGSSHAPDHSSTAMPAYLHAIGTYDPDRADVGPALARMPADLFTGTGVAAGDDASRRALGGRTLLPSADFAAAVAQRPELLTTLSALAKLHTAPYTDLSADAGVNVAAPISSIRVRLAGPLGMDALSKERARLAAERIRQATGLQVDLTLGASATTSTVALPAGTHGRPALQVAEPRLRSGVAAVVVQAVDRKSLLLAVLVLVACVLAVANATSAVVRTRSTELGVLACLGWPRRRLFSLVLLESLALGALAGLAGTVVAVAGAPALGVHLNPRYTLLAIPAALLLTMIASLPPAWRATRAAPAAAIRPGVVAVRRRRVPHRISGLAWANVLRSGGRSAVGALSLALGVASLSLLFVITVSFRGTVTGTVLGDAITVQVRATDYVAAALTVLLGAATVADVVYVNIRERSAEFALLAATGWPDGAVARLAGYEAVALGMSGGVLGAGAGLAAAAALTGGLPGLAWLVGAVAAAVGLLVTVAAAVLPVRSLRGLPIALLLAEE